MEDVEKWEWEEKMCDGDEQRGELERGRVVKEARGWRRGEASSCSCERVRIRAAQFGWHICFWFYLLRDEQGLCSLRSLALEVALACTHLQQNLSKTACEATAGQEPRPGSDSSFLLRPRIQHLIKSDYKEGAAPSKSLRLPELETVPTRVLFHILLSFFRTGLKMWCSVLQRVLRDV